MSKPRGGRRPNAGRRALDLTDAQELIRGDLSLAEVSRRTGISESTLRRHGLRGKPRPRSDRYSPFWCPTFANEAAWADIPAQLRDWYYRERALGILTKPTRKDKPVKRPGIDPNPRFRRLQQLIDIQGWSHMHEYMLELGVLGDPRALRPLDASEMPHWNNAVGYLKVRLKHGSVSKAVVKEAEAHLPQEHLERLLPDNWDTLSGAEKEAIRKRNREELLRPKDTPSTPKSTPSNSNKPRGIDSQVAEALLEQMRERGTPAEEALKTT